MRIFCFGFFCFAFLSTTAMAQQPQAATTQTSAPAKSEQDKSKKLNVDKFVDELDKNRDGCVSHSEWVNAGLLEFNFEALSAQAEKKDCVTKKELLIGNPPDGIDINGDGYITVAEMIEYSRKNSGGGNGNSNTGGSPPGGAARGN
jgi:hypothetical protein